MTHPLYYYPKPGLVNRLLFSIRRGVYAIYTTIILLSLVTKGKLHILLADDDEDDRDIFTKVMAETSAEVVVSTAKNGKEALNMLNGMETLPDLIFLDLNMPVMGGLACLKEIRANHRYKDILVFIYSTSYNEVHVQESFTDGANLYIPKPDSYLALRKMATFILSLNFKNFVTPNRKEFLLKFNS